MLASGQRHQPLFQAAAQCKLMASALRNCLPFTGNLTSPGSTCSPAAHALPANGPRDLAQHIDISFDCFTCVAKWKVAASCWQLKNPMLWKACRTGKAKGSRSGDASLSLPTAVSHIKLAISQSLPEPCKLYLNWSRPRC